MKVNKNVRKLNTRKKRVLNVNELNAYKVAYGKPLKTKDFVSYVGMPALLFAGFTFLLLYYWWLSIFMAITGALYGMKVLLPKSVEKVYQYQSFAQRNKFINNITQILTDDGKTVTMALEITNTRAEGEFQKDINELQARLIGADNTMINKAFTSMENKYQDDVIFAQFLEQLETAMLEGRTNIDTLKDIKTYHNDMKKKQSEYQNKKNGHLTDVKMLGVVVVIFLLAVSYSFGISTYINDFARQPIGWVTCGVYMLLMGQFFRKFSFFLFDDSVLEVSL
ncbi:hypothetical protein ACQRXC_26860 (plasmid) [Niallia taxi]|uniref:hypothetical protein n=2 Tax=Bacillati TaxID=1783272 RepID=UPI001F1BBF17|nr:hypothetical protein [Niallia taxi]MDK8643834.1 hypothetical protein [Niallia taxi]MED4057616.1 hypothetical protein [Niallia taxi]